MNPEIKNSVPKSDGQAKAGQRLADVLDEIALRCASLPVLDSRNPDEILGYDEDGLPS